MDHEELSGGPLLRDSLVLAELASGPPQDPALAPPSQHPARPRSRTQLEKSEWVLETSECFPPELALAALRPGGVTL